MNTSVRERLPWRFRLGLASFVAAFGIHLITIAAIVVGAAATTVGSIVAINFVLNKVLLLAAVAFLGREGFNRIKTTFVGTVQLYLLPDEVGPVRHQLGLVLLIVPIVMAWVSPYVADIAPSVGRNTVRDGVIGDGVLILSLFMLGGGFWEKLRALFVREARVVFPDGAVKS